jgi:hypothetical protein
MTATATTNQTEVTTTASPEMDSLPPGTSSTDKPDDSGPASTPANPRPRNPMLPAINRARRMLAETCDPEKAESLERFIRYLESLPADSPSPVALWQIDYLLMWLDRLTPFHLDVLQFVSDPRMWMAARGRRLESEQAHRKPFVNFLALVASDLLASIPDGWLKQIETELRSADLIVTGDFAASQDSIGLLENKASELGRLLVRMACPELVPNLPAVPQKLMGGAGFGLHSQLRSDRAAAIQDHLADFTEQRNRHRQQAAVVESQTAEQDQMERERQRQAALADSLETINRQHPTYPVEESLMAAVAPAPAIPSGQ